jgi:hypothetical protein
MNKIKQSLVLPNHHALLRCSYRIIGYIKKLPCRRDDPSSWSDACGWPPSYKGIVNTLEVAHQDFVWRVRKHPRLLQVRLFVMHVM